jgi:uncharacterized membrane protein
MHVQGNVVGDSGLFGWLGGTAAMSALWAALTGWVPYAVAIIPLIYFLIMIWETRTFTHARYNWMQKHIARKYAKLKAREKVTLAKLEAMEVQRKARVTAREAIKEAEFEAEKLVVKNSIVIKAQNASKDALEDLKNLNKI